MFEVNRTLKSARKWAASHPNYDWYGEDGAGGIFLNIDNCCFVRVPEEAIEPSDLDGRRRYFSAYNLQTGISSGFDLVDTGETVNAANTTAHVLKTKRGVEIWLADKYYAGDSYAYKSTRNKQSVFILDGNTVVSYVMVISHK